MEDMDGKPVVGVQIAHIKGAEPSAPRYEITMTDEERAAFPNLVLLCQAHHTAIDRISPEDYPVAVLEAWKQQNEPNGGLEALRGLTESTLEGLIEAAVAKAGRVREAKVEISCGVQTGPAGWTAFPFEIVRNNESLHSLPKQLCVIVTNTGLTDVSFEGIQIFSEHQGTEGNPRYIPDVHPSELYPQFPFRLLNGDHKAWFVPFEALQIMEAAILNASGGRPISSVFVLVRLATGEQAESLPVLWSEIEPLLSASNM